MKTLSQRSVFYYFFISIVAAIAVINAEKEADYMSQFLKAVNPTPTGWSNNTHHCKWIGVTCRSTVVTAIRLQSISLAGTLPPGLSTLTNLTHIDLHNNSLTGPLPYLSGLFMLQTVYLGHNNFTSVPKDCFQMLPALRTLNLSNNLNLLAWIFPDGLRYYSSLLHTLDFEATNLVGTLSSDMFEWLPSLHTIVLSHNTLSGTLPLSLGNSKVMYLRLNNQGGRINDQDGFTGKIDVISSMKFLSQAWLNNNWFYGPIPSSFNSTYVFDLQLEWNLFYGLVPPSLLTLPSLKNISLDNNYLQGPIPVFHKGVKATWESNRFCRSDVGPCDPQVMTLLKIFESFLDKADFVSNRNDACNNKKVIKCQRGKIVSVDLASPDWVLNGTISPAFSNLTNLVNLSLAGNGLTGSIPESLTTLNQLQFLDVSNNNLSGPIPKFPSKVKLITRGNALLGQNISRQLVVGGHNATSPPDGDRSKRTTLKLVLIAGASLCSVGFLVLMVIICICTSKRNPTFVQRWIFKTTTKSSNGNVADDFIERCNLLPIKQYRYADLERMTNSFQEKIGKGGFGVVYKASLPDGRPVAVKMIRDSKGDGKAFINEVDSISRTSHVNIVSLLGFCYEHKRALIYEFMSKGSLDKYIFNTGLPDGICSLDCETIYKIAIGIARGLEYLHQGCASRIVHLDLKPQNILLDENFCPKIADFGLAKICKRSVSAVPLPAARGTIGYMPPEVCSGRASHKSDVYSYGMLVLDMIGRRKNNNATGGSQTSEYFPEGIYKDLEQRNTCVNSLEISDEENDSMRKITMVCLWCIQMNPKDRPSSSKIIEMLQGPLESVSFPPRSYSRSQYLPHLQSLPSSSNILEASSGSLLKSGSIKSDHLSSGRNENVI